MQHDRYKNFRLRGIPLRYESRVVVRELVKAVLTIQSGVSVAVHSLAVNPIGHRSKVATLSFHPIPDLLSDRSKNVWEFDLPPNEDVAEDSFGGREILVFDTHFFGFTPLQHTKDDQCSVDIIAISGLAGHAFGSFKERHGSFMWLRDDLTLEFSHARVLIYGYNTELIRSSSFQNLTDLGRALLIDMKGIMQSDQPRSIVFIGHSLGGLVIKEALARLTEDVDKQNASFLSSVSGFLFFGVPHRGMAIESLVPLVKDYPNRSLLESLNKNSALLEHLDRDFREALGTRQPTIISFYETEKSPTAAQGEDGKWEQSGPPEVSVDVLSATCGSKHQYPINRNHSEMVKYRNQHDEFYTRVKNVLAPLVNTSSSLPVRNKEVGQHRAYAKFDPRSASYIDISLASMPLPGDCKECLRSLAFRDQETRYYNIHSADNTCGWLLEDAQYQAWLERSRGLFWIKGNPGAGKSVLMKFAVANMNHTKSGELVVSFFIHGRGTWLQKSPLGIFRAVLNSLLENFPGFLVELTQRFAAREKRYGSYGLKRWKWEEKELEEFLFYVLTKGTKSQPVVIFVDALDECGKDSAIGLLEFFKDVMDHIEREEGQVKICFSSRHYPILGLNTVPTVHVEERNDKDIRKFVQRRLKAISLGAERQKIESEILLKAQGGFQWAVLVTAMVVDGNATGTKVAKLHEKLTTIPETLDELYTDILSDITEMEEFQMTKLFRWILFAARPLSAQELREALTTNKDMTWTTISDLRSQDSWIDNIVQFETHVKHISRGLVEFQTRDLWEQYESNGENWDREAQFVHQSVADYILQKFLSRKGHFRDVSQPQVGAAHFEISRSCLRYLALREVLEGTRLSRGKLCAKFPLLPYLVRFLFHHIRKVEQEGLPQADLLRLIQWDRNNEYLRKVASLWRILDPDCAHAPMGWPFVGATPLHILVAFGSKSALETFLLDKNVEVDGRDLDGNTPLLLAIRECHQDMALILLNRSMEWELRLEEAVDPAIIRREVGRQKSSLVDVNSENNDGDTPLTIALTEKAEKVIFKLIEAGADLKFFGRESALVSFAIRNRNKMLLMKLIEKKVKLDGAICFAVNECSHTDDDGILKELLSELFRAGANTSKSAEFDMTSKNNDDEDDEDEDEYEDEVEAVLLASRRGQADMVNVLLSHGASATFRTEQGRFPLLAAAEGGHEETVRLLLQNAPSTYGWKDNFGRTALDAALERRNENTALILIADRYERSNDDFGQTALLIKAARFGLLKVVESLLEKGADVEAKDKSGQAPLFLALDIGHEAIVRLFLEKGANTEAKDRFGQTPLSLALENGHEAIVRLLLEKGADVETKNKFGCTPLFSTLRKGPKAVRLFLEKGANTEAKDRFGQTPLFLALENGHEAIVRLLLEKGADIEAKDQNGQTPLFLALKKSHEAIIKLLLEKGADIKAEEQSGQMLRTWALQKGHQAIIELLLERMI